MAKLSTKARDKLPSSMFGIASTRSFPLNDKTHVLQAIRMFSHAPKNKQAELRRKIRKRIKELGMKVDF